MTSVSYSLVDEVFVLKAHTKAYNFSTYSLVDEVFVLQAHTKAYNFSIIFFSRSSICFTGAHEGI
jgi:hypothetical protein